MRNFVNLHVRTQDAGAVRALARALREPGLTLYVVPDAPWYGLYDEGLEAGEDPEALLRALREASRLGRAVLFWVQEDEGLFWALAEEGRVLYRRAAGMEDRPDAREGTPPADLDPAALAAAEAGRPKTAAARALGALLGLHPDHAVVGFDDLLELDEEGGLPGEVWILEDDRAPDLRLERPLMEEDHAGG